MGHWMEAFFVGCSLGDRTKFENTMEVCSNFTSIDDIVSAKSGISRGMGPKLGVLEQW
jgi:hypothetical protein